MHLSRRPDDSYRPNASVPQGYGANRERRGRTDHSGEFGRRVGLDFQLRTRQVSMEAPATYSVSSHCNVRQADAVDDWSARSSAIGRRTRRRGLSVPQTLHADLASFLRADRPASPSSLGHGRRAHAKTLVWRSTDAHRFPRAPSSLRLARPEYGWHLVAAVSSGSVD